MSAEYLSQYKFAKLNGVSRQAVSKAVKEGRIIATKSGIDPENPTNKYFVDQLRYNRNPKIAEGEEADAIKRARRGRRTKLEEAERKLKEIEAPVKPGLPRSRPLPEAPDDSDEHFLLQPQTEKDYQATRFTKIKSDHALLKYFRDFEVLIDSDALAKKMGKFTSFLLSHLIDLPTKYSDLLWSRAESSDEPEAAIRVFLEDKIGDVIKEAKKAAAELEPPKCDAKYMLVRVDEEDQK